MDGRVNLGFGRGIELEDHVTYSLPEALLTLYRVHSIYSPIGSMDPSAKYLLNRYVDPPGTHPSPPSQRLRLGGSELQLSVSHEALRQRRSLPSGLCFGRRRRLVDLRPAGAERPRGQAVTVAVTCSGERCLRGSGDPHCAHVCGPCSFTFYRIPA